jgi:hypothetical protein
VTDPAVLAASEVSESMSKCPAALLRRLKVDYVLRLELKESD